MAEHTLAYTDGCLCQQTDTHMCGCLSTWLSIWVYVCMCLSLCVLLGTFILYISPTSHIQTQSRFQRFESLSPTLSCPPFVYACACPVRRELMQSWGWSSGTDVRRSGLLVHGGFGYLGLFQNFCLFVCLFVCLFG